MGTVPQRSISAAGPGVPDSVTATADSAYFGYVRTSQPTVTPMPVTGSPSDQALPVARTRALQQAGPQQSTLHHDGTTQQPAPPARGQGQGLSAQSAHDVPSLIRRRHRALSLLLILFVVALVPAVRYLVRRA
jgi:hypothetical protein